MSTKKYADWLGWWDGLRSKAMKAGAESLITNIGALLTTNGLANMQILGLHDIGMNWKMSLATMSIQFTLRVVFAAAQYVASKPDPDVIVQQSDTTFQSKSPDGKIITQTHSTTVTTPISMGPKTEPEAGSQPKTQQ